MKFTFVSATYTPTCPFPFAPDEIFPDIVVFPVAYSPTVPVVVPTVGLISKSTSEFFA